MCYRVARDFSDVDVKKDKKFKVDRVLEEFLPKYNVSPSQGIPVIIPGSRILDVYRWGLIPHWAKNMNASDKLANARSESLKEKPSFRESFKKKRCLVLASGFYEWDKNKQPHYIQVKEEKIFAFAGLYEDFKDEDSKSIKSCTIITCEPNNFMKKIHDRMPVILYSKDYEKWLKGSNLEEINSLLVPFDDKLMKEYEVTKKMNSSRYESPDVIERLNSKKENQRTLI
ncbi:MAG: SOS response-associated peptidase [Candidatus Pacearchaeota archaeon]|jgi:putative SOS response-associated peptidase YedK